MRGAGIYAAPRVFLGGTPLTTDRYVAMLAPAWLECQTVLALGEGRKAEPRRRYWEYVQEAVREQVGLGGAG